MLAVIFVVLATANVLVSFTKYPEQYLPTWKYQLKNDLAKGNQEAIQYYNDTYIANGKQLFGNDYLDMTTVIGKVKCFTKKAN